MRPVQPLCLLALASGFASVQASEANDCTQFFVGDKTSVAKQYHHHGNITALWYDLLKPRFAKGPAYPINYGANSADFEPVFRSLIRKNISDAFDERWPKEFLPALDGLVKQANDQRSLNATAASELYFRANALGHIAHYPSLHTKLRYSIYETQVAAFLNATSSWSTPYSEVFIPHKHAVAGEGHVIPTFFRPAPRNASGPAPVLVRLAGIDGFRPDQPHNAEQMAHEAGYAYLIGEIPGTGASPALPRDPASPDRQLSSILDWIDSRRDLDSDTVIVWGVSTGGYYGFRAAYTHHDRILGAVGNGGWSNCALTRHWMDIADVAEYPTSLSRTFAWKFGYDPIDQYEAFLNDLKSLKRNFSLVDTGLADRDSAPLLMVDGKNDTIFPIEDTTILLEHGLPKTARVIAGAHHPGEPEATPIIFKWIASLLRSTTA